MHKAIYIAIILLLFSCKSDAELAMERGIQYYEWAVESSGNNVDKAVIEFKQVVRLLSSKLPNISRNEALILGKAHHNLAVAYAKKKWYPGATKEAKKAFALYPSEENKKVLELIRKKSTSSQEAIKKSIQ